MMVEKNGYDALLVDEMIATNQALADRIDLVIDMGTILFPNYSSDPEIAALYEANKDKLLITS